MISKTVVQQLIDQWLEDKDYFLADLSINGDKILVEIDHAEGVWIEDCVSLSRFIEEGLDRDEEDFDLEVVSPSRCFNNMKSTWATRWKSSPPRARSSKVVSPLLLPKKSLSCSK